VDSAVIIITPVFSFNLWPKMGWPGEVWWLWWNFKFTRHHRSYKVAYDGRWIKVLKRPPNSINRIH